MRGSPTAQISVAIVCIILGALLMLQYQTHGSIVKAQLAESSVDQAEILSNLYDSNVRLRKEAEALAAQEAELSHELEPDSLASLQADLARLRVLNAAEAVTGSGVELAISSALQVEHVLDVVNELKNAGAEAISVNGVRLAAESAVSAKGGAIVVDGYDLGDRLVFRAIGNPDSLDRALERKGGVLSYLRSSYPGTRFDLTKQATVVLPARGPKPGWRFATAVQ